MAPTKHIHSEYTVYTVPLQMCPNYKEMLHCICCVISIVYTAYEICLNNVQPIFLILKIHSQYYVYGEIMYTEAN